MKTFADFKRRLTAAIDTNQLIQVRSFLKDGQQQLPEKEPVPVCHVQSNAFSLLRNGKKSWVEFGKASQWVFTENTATHTGSLGGKLVFEFLA